VAASRVLDPFTSWLRAARETVIRNTYQPAASMPRPGWRRALLLATLVVVGAILSLARTPIRDWSVLWAEDALVFLDGAYHSDLSVLLVPYSGYLHVVPRLLAEISALFPLEAASVVMTVLAAVTLSAVACASYVFLETVVRGVFLRVAVWLSIVAAPVGGGEVLNNAANLHWFMLIAGVCAIVARPRPGAGMVAAQAVVLSLAVLSDALGLLLIPLVVLRATLLRGRSEWVKAIIVGVAGVIQLGGTFVGTIMLGGRQSSDSAPTLGEFVDFHAVRVIAPAIVGDAAAQKALLLLGPLLTWGAVAALAIILIVLILNGESNRGQIVLLALGSLAFSAVAGILQWEWIGGSSRVDFNTVGRYAVVPVILLVLALLVAADAAFQRSSSRRIAVGLGAAVLAWVLVLTAIDATRDNHRAGTPSWSDGVREAITRCEDGAESALLPVAPAFLTFGLPCSTILEHAPR